jgi:hypothetical protein
MRCRLSRINNMEKEHQRKHGQKIARDCFLLASRARDVGEERVLGSWLFASRDAGEGRRAAFARIGLRGRAISDVPPEALEGSRTKQSATVLLSQAMQEKEEVEPARLEVVVVRLRYRLSEPVRSCGIYCALCLGLLGTVCRLSARSVSGKNCRSLLGASSDPGIVRSRPGYHKRPKPRPR